MRRKKIFTQDQINTLSQNPHVSRCSEKSVSYTHAFKILAVQRYHQEGISSAQIFKDAGLDPTILGKNISKQRLLDWRKVHATRGDAGLAERRGKNSIGGGRPKTKGVTDADKIKRLEIEVAYLKEKNAFLAKLRALYGG